MTIFSRNERSSANGSAFAEPGFIAAQRSVSFRSSVPLSDRLSRISFARCVAATALAISLTLFAGCGNGLGLVPVEGVVTLDGQPLPNAEVNFRPTDGRPSLGKTDDQGKFRLLYSREEMGALPGKHQVSIATASSSDDGSPDSDAAVAKERVPARYNSATTLKADVRSGMEPLTFDLQSK